MYVYVQSVPCVTYREMFMVTISLKDSKYRADLPHTMEIKYQYQEGVHGVHSEWLRVSDRHHLHEEEESFYR